MENYKLRKGIDVLVSKGWKYLGNGNLEKEGRIINLDTIEDEGRISYLITEDGHCKIYDYLTNL